MIGSTNSTHSMDPPLQKSRPTRVYMRGDEETAGPSHQKTVQYDTPEELVEARFTNPVLHPETAFSGNTEKLLQGLKGKDRERGLNWLKRQEAYLLTRKAPHRQGVFQRQKIVVGDIGDCFELDLADFGADRDQLLQNDMHRYALVALDQLSRYVMIEALKRKDAVSVANAFDRMLSKAGGAMTPIKVATDHGTEFSNKWFKQVMKKWGIVKHYIPSDTEIKCPMVERSIRSLKMMTTKYFMQNNTLRWYDVIQDIVRSYNHTKHSVLKTSPIKVLHMGPVEIEQLWQRLYKTPLKPKLNKKIIQDLNEFKVGDYVRISVLKGLHEKGYTPTYSREVYRVYARKYGYPRLVYKVMDLTGDPVPGVFYSEQLQKHIGAANRGRVIEKVVKDDPNKRQVTVKWLGWDPKFNQTLSYEEYNGLVRRQQNRYKNAWDGDD